VGLGFHEGISAVKRAERDLNSENFDVLDGFMTLWFVDFRVLLNSKPRSN